MKQKLRNIVASTSSYTEIFINMLIIIGIVVFSASLIKDLYFNIIVLVNGNLEFDVERFLARALQLIIGVEFVKMLAKHTMESALDVLMFAIARKIIVEHNYSMLDMLVGIVAISILFILKKFSSCYQPANKEESNGNHGCTPIEKVNRQRGTIFQGRGPDAAQSQQKETL